MRIGRVAGVQLIFSNWFLLIMLLFGMAGLGLKALGVFAAVFWHEAAHAVVAAALGYRVREIELLPFGGVARIEGAADAGSASEIMMAVAGPLASLVAAAAFYWAAASFPAWQGFSDFLLRANLTLAVFNLLPAMPLDGGRILRALLAPRTGYRRATAIAAGLGRLLAVSLTGMVAGEIWQSGTVNLTFLFAAAFLWLTAGSETAAAGFRTMRLLARKKADLLARGVMPTAHFTATATTAVRDVVARFGPDHYNFILVVDENCRLKGTLSETEVWDMLPHRGLYARLGDFF